MGKSNAIFSFWHEVLHAATNGTGLVSRDHASEALIRQVFADNVKRDLLQRNKVFGLAVLDPVWLYPIGPVHVKKKSIFKGTLNACNLRLHNMKVGCKWPYRFTASIAIINMKNSWRF